MLTANLSAFMADFHASNPDGFAFAAILAAVLVVCLLVFVARALQWLGPPALAPSHSKPPREIPPDPKQTPPMPPLPTHPSRNALGDRWDTVYKLILRDELHRPYECRIGEARHGLIQIAIGDRRLAWMSSTHVVLLAPKDIQP